MVIIIFMHVGKFWCTWSSVGVQGGKMATLRRAARFWLRSRQRLLTEMGAYTSLNLEQLLEARR
jgi:hypothetical protein